MGSKGGGDQVQRSEPWGPQAPYLQYGFGQAQQLYNTGGPQFFGGATYTPFSQQTEQGLGMTEQRALAGSPVTDAAQNLAAQSMGSQPNMYGAGGYVQQQLGGQPNLASLSQFAGSQPGGNVFDPRAFQPVQQQQQLPTAPDPTQTQLGGNVAGVGQGGVDRTGASQLAGVGVDPYDPNAQAFAGVGMGQQTLPGAQQNFLSQLSGLPGATEQALTQTAQGQSLTGNPYLDAQFDIAAQKVTDRFNREISPGLAAQFSLAGRTGSDALADVQTRAAGEVSDSLAQLANQIYGGNYQAERDRQLQAAGQLGSLSQSQQGLGLQAAGQGADLYSTAQQQDIARRGLAGQMAGQAGQQDIARRGLAQDIYGTGQQQDIARRGLQSQSDLGRLGLGANIYGTDVGAGLQSRAQDITQRGQDIQAGATAGQQDISRLGLAGQLYGNQLSNQLGAANLGANLYGQQLGQQNIMAGLANSLANQDYADIDRLLGVGQQVEGLGNRALQDQINRFNFYQNLPQNNLANYIAAIQGNYGGTTTAEGGGGSPLTGALGGAATGFSVGGPWGALIGAGLGLLG